MGFSKKTGKGRLDKYYYLAKDQGYRARSAFKLVQLNKKYNFLDQARVVIDLCAAPGGWLQVATKFMPMSHVIVGVDLVPIKPIPGVKTFVADITTEKCRAELRKELKTWKADVVLHDGAPNVGKSWLQDAYSQAELVLHSLKLATEFLGKNGVFVTKVFRSKEYNSLLWVFNQLFGKVEATKPASSRSVSAEIFVVCREFKAPAHIDPRLLDPKYVFEDIIALQNPIKTDLLHPEKRNRHRDGYEDGATMLFKSATVEEFIHSVEPNTLLATCNKFTYNGETDPLVIAFAKENHEVLELFEDLKVLGRREFKILSKWRKDVRERMGIIEIKTTTEQVQTVAHDPLDELTEMAKKQDRLERREKKKKLELKAKQRMRMQLEMENTGDLAEEYAHNEGLFSLKNPSKWMSDEDEMTGAFGESTLEEETVQGEVSETISSDEEDIIKWEQAFEEDFQRRKALARKRDVVESVRASRLDGDDVYVSEAEVSMPVAVGSDKQSDDSEVEAERDDFLGRSKLAKSLVGREEAEAISKVKTDLWYSNPIFRDLEEDKEDLIDPESSKKKAEKKRKADKKAINKSNNPEKKTKKSEPGEIIFVKAEMSQSDEEKIDEEAKDAMLTPAGMTLAAKIAADKEKAKKELVDQSFNRYTFKDDFGLPKWFLEDEGRHNRPQKPITKEGIALLKAKLRQIDAQPIKKVLEAKGRNRKRAMKKLEALKKKAAIIADSEDLGEKQKGDQIQKLLSKANKPQKKETKLVIARGSNRGIKGRPKGIKGHYKMVDSRMKKDLRAEGRVKNKKK